METDDLNKHLRAAEEVFTALRRGEALRVRDPARGIEAMRTAIRRAAGAFTPAVLDEIRREVTAVAFWHRDGRVLLQDLDQACGMLPEPEAGEGWLAGFLTFLTALHGVLVRAVAGAPQSNPQASHDQAPGSARATDARLGVPQYFAPKEPAACQATMGPSLKPRLLTVEQAAVYLGRTEESIRHLLAGGTLKAVRIDRRVCLDVRDLDRLIEAGKG